MDHTKKVCDRASIMLAFLVSYLVQKYSPVIVQEEKLAITGRNTGGLQYILLQAQHLVSPPQPHILVRVLVHAQDSF